MVRAAALPRVLQTRDQGRDKLCLEQGHLPTWPLLKHNHGFFLLSACEPLILSG